MRDFPSNKQLRHIQHTICFQDIPILFEKIKRKSSRPGDLLDPQAQTTSRTSCSERDTYV